MAAQAQSLYQRRGTGPAVWRAAAIGGATQRVATAPRFGPRVRDRHPPPVAGPIPRPRMRGLGDATNFPFMKPGGIHEVLRPIGGTKQQIDELALRLVMGDPDGEARLHLLDRPRKHSRVRRPGQAPAVAAAAAHWYRR